MSAHRPPHGLIGRRTLLTSLAAASGLVLSGCAQGGRGSTTGAAVASPSSPESSSSPAPSTSAAPTFAPARPIAAGDEAFVAVTAASMWTEPGLNRQGVDEPSMGRPVDLAAWNDRMPDYQSRYWLLGKLDSQALVGSPADVLEIANGWAKVSFSEQPAPHRDEGFMTGWVPAVQLVHDERFAQLREEHDTVVVTADKATVTSAAGGGEDLLAVSFETRLPLLEEKDGHVRVALPDSEDGWLSEDSVKVLKRGEKLPTPTAEQVIETGKRFLGLPYLWAGVSSYGFDCSGFTYSIFRHHGIDMPRDSGPQLRESGFPSVEREDWQPGDLLFFSFQADPDRIRHVAVYVGDGKILHSPESGKTIEIVTVASYDTGNTYAGAVRPPLATA
ncbi:C40 family peptidase [Micrococcus lylae]|uniref:C40 family peptidase n=1 Tax=Micrococcus lylae TaxID=1273 RepID=UPI000C7F828D|nr:C40 family peptidase [Micrococcus lylae]WIK82778.1 C40 family peptidase [Micrococcus lylae]